MWTPTTHLVQHVPFKGSVTEMLISESSHITHRPLIKLHLATISFSQIVLHVNVPKDNVLSIVRTLAGVIWYISYNQSWLSIMKDAHKTVNAALWGHAF